MSLQKLCVNCVHCYRGSDRYGNIAPSCWRPVGVDKINGAVIKSGLFCSSERMDIRGDNKRCSVEGRHYMRGTRPPRVGFISRLLGACS